LVPGSVSQAPGGNLPPPTPPTPVVTVKKATPRCAKGRKPSHGKCVKAKGRKTKAKKAGHDQGVGR
jgi:hypothetical protein